MEAAAPPRALLCVAPVASKAASVAIEAEHPAAQNIMERRRPTFSMI